MQPQAVAELRFSPGKGVEIRSKDRKYSLAIKLRAQLLYLFENAPGEPSLHSFQVRRARLVFGGNVFGVHNKYKVEFAFSPGDSALAQAGPKRTPLLDWYFDFDYLRDLNIRVGQYKVYYSRQRVISSGDLQMVDRGVANAEFNLDRDIGLTLFSNKLLGLDRLRYYAGIFINQGRDAASLRTFGPMYIGRVEILPLGNFHDYEEVDFHRTSPRLSLGAAYAYLDNASNNRGILGVVPRDGGTTDFHNVTADMELKVFGFSVVGEFFWRRGLRNSGNLKDTAGNPVTPELSRDGYGLLAQAGLLLPHLPIEIVGRYGFVQPDPRNGGSSLGALYEAGGGINYYVARHLYKFQLDYFRLWDSERPIAEGDNRVRLQLQLSL